MNTPRKARWSGVALLTTLAVAAATGCSGSSGSSSRGAGGSDRTPSPIAAASTSEPIGTTPPQATAAVPDGVYRTQIEPSELIKANVSDTSNAGTWTVTVKNGTYRLQCRWLTNTGSDCGNDGVTKDVYVEAGWLRGTGSVVWFVHDPVATAKLTGCNPATTICGPMGGYHMRWQQEQSGALAFTDWVGLGDEAGGLDATNVWTLKPWQKIG